MGFLCALGTAVDVVRRRQHMSVMNLVWPLTMLFGGIAWLVFYARRGRAALRGREGDRPEHSMRTATAIGASHCGAGCTLGDIVGESALVLVPGLGAVFGVGWLFTDRMFAAWILDFVLAFLFGIAFQYQAILPARGLSFRQGIRQAVKADALSILAWQVGMYAVMGIAQLLLLPALFGGRAGVLTPEFWFMMQLAMIAGFATSYPVNALLIHRGVKERM